MKGKEKIKLPNNWPWKLPALHLSPLVITKRSQNILSNYVKKIESHLKCNSCCLNCPPKQDNDFFYL